MIVSTPAFLRSDNFEEVIVSAVSMIFGFGMGPPDSRLNRKVMARKNLAIDIVHLFPPQYTSHPPQTLDYCRRRESRGAWTSPRRRKFKPPATNAKSKSSRYGAIAKP